MSSARAPRLGVSIGFFCLIVSWFLPAPASAAWVNGTATQFQVGGKLVEIVPQLVSGAPGIANSPALVNPTCGSQGGTSLALVRGTKLAGVDPVLYPTALVVSCLDNGGSATIRSRLNFINPITFSAGGTNVPAGAVVKQLSTTIAGVVSAPSNGWAHLVHRPDKGDLLGCGSDGSLYSIDYSQTNSVSDGTATKLSTPTLTSCGGLAWDAENDTIYQGIALNGNKIGSVVRFKEGAVAPDASFTTSLACPANGLAISGGVLLVSCAGLVNNTLVIQRLDKNTGAGLGVYPSVSLPVPGSPVAGFQGLTALSNDPGLGDLACDPATFQNDSTGRDLYRDAMWSRRGNNGNGVAAVEFPAFTCGLPSNSVVVQNGVSYSPLAAGLSVPGATGLPGQLPLTACFDAGGIVIDADGDGFPDCWEANQGGSGAGGGGGIDFNGDGTRDMTLCAKVDTNGDGVPDAIECAAPNHKDLFVEVAWMQYHQPDPQALSQKQSVTTAGVQSVREAFGAAPVGNPDGTTGIRMHIRVDGAPVTFTNLNNIPTSHACYVALTPCTGPVGMAADPSVNTTCLGASDAAADYDAIKTANFGRFDLAADPATDALNPSPLTQQALNAKRLAVRHVLFAHNLVGNPNGGSSSSGCSEVGGDDGVVSLGSFVMTTVNNVPHGRGTTDQQAGTFMHEFGHLLGLQHGGDDNVNCKPNYRSVMSYPRQFAGSPIPSRRLDYSRSVDPVITGNPLSGSLSEGSLNELNGMGVDPSLGPIAPFFPLPDQIVFGPGAWSLVPSATSTNSLPLWPLQAGNTPVPINWDRSTKGQGPSFQSSTSADISGGATSGCDTSGVLTSLAGFNDWANLLYRLSAAVDFAGGARSETPFSAGTTTELTKEDETNLFLIGDIDTNGVGDGQDCGKAIGVTTSSVDPTNTTIQIGANPTTLGFATPSGGAFLVAPSGSPRDDVTYTGTSSVGLTGVAGINLTWPSGTTVVGLCPLHQCGIRTDGSIFFCSTHRIDIKPSFALPKVINLGTEANVTIAIFSETNWNAPAEIMVDAVSLAAHPLTFTVENVVEPVKTNSNGSGTCSISDVADPITGQKDGIKDLKCQFPSSGLPTGTHYGVVNGSFLDPSTNQFRAFSARQEVTILP